MTAYKYRGGGVETEARDLASLVSNYFWAPTAVQLNDPREAYINENSIRKSLINDNASELSLSVDNLLKIRHTVGVYSLSQTPLDELMWAYYASSHTGFCIEYNLDRMQREAGSNWDIMKVTYHQSPQKIQLEDLSLDGGASPMIGKLIGTKSQRWAHEQEIRVITPSSGKNYYAPVALTGVYFGCRCSQGFILRVRKLLKGRKVMYYKMAFSSNSYSMNATPLASDSGIDGFPEVHLAPVAAGAIPKLEDTKEENKPIFHYLEKAIEVVRRDNTCSKVISVHFSSEKRANGKAQICVGYETNGPTQGFDLRSVLFAINDDRLLEQVC
jgi:hypothetical protein